MRTQRTQPTIHARVGLGIVALSMLCSCAGLPAPAAEPTNEREWAGEFEDCSKWANLCGRLFHGCRRLSVSNDATFRLVVKRREDSEVLVGTWHEGSDGCLQLERRAPDAPRASIPPAPTVDGDASESETPKDGSLEELCTFDPDACVSVPSDVASGRAPTICRASDGLLMQFSDGTRAELTPARKQ